MRTLVYVRFFSVLDVQRFREKLSHNCVTALPCQYVRRVRDVVPCTSIDHQLEEWDVRLLLQELLEGCVTMMVYIVGIRIHSNQCAGTAQPADIDGSWRRGFIFGHGFQEVTVFQQQENGICFVQTESCL